MTKSQADVSKKRKERTPEGKDPKNQKKAAASKKC